MDKIQRVLCTIGRWDLAQKYYLKVSVTESLTPFPSAVEEYITTNYGTRSQFALNIYFKRKPGVSCLIYGCIKESVEKFYSEILPNLLRIKKIIESFNLTVFIPSIESVFVSQQELFCSIYVSAEEFKIDQIISTLKLEIIEEETKN